MAWFKENAPAYNIDIEHIGVVGSSAGGHLAALLCTLLPEDDLGKPPELKVADTQPKACVCFNPVTDLTAEIELEPFFETLFGCKKMENPALYKTASPALRITGKEPPFLFPHSITDTVTPFRISQDMAKRLQAVGVEARVVTIQNQAHGFAYQLGNAEQKRCSIEVLAFLNKHLK
ncbi:MAG: hypothetical protein A2293_13680 [Elusimicrobia bacterium RIFOXYB2_FULL_49_7]|nr:MAG: hypothetical protein A2293_13680 [Elusimicrobia bacterium RIFOXYB2_FULL_49_7]